MEQITWRFAVPLYPIHFQNTIGAVMQHVASYVNHFVPDLNAFLVKAEKETLRLLTSDENPGVSHGTLVPIRPELPTLYIRAQLTVSVFSPRVGMKMTATVSALKSRLIICKTDIPNVSLSVPLCPESDVSNASLSSEKMILDTTVKVNDVICVRLSAVSLHPNVVLLRGNLISVLSSDAGPVQTLASKDSHSSDDGGDSLFAKPRKRRKVISSGVLKPDEESITIKSEPEPEQSKQKKRPFTEDERPVDMSLVDSSDVIEPPKKKKRKPELEVSSSVVGSLLKLALPAPSDEVKVSAEDYKVIVETPVPPTSSKCSLTTSRTRLKQNVPSFYNKPEPF
ncbi:hypothetical protein CRM22_006333 [Opisthorchis felineus]|uniref:RPA43 OB domain-containing protein n=1 Tax=Opisthorchis felineus TaxID=147828 RepID=A0A4S2LLF8_OPIFE|nr:hypothetical protein CRM22_006333 [Opisthorchis felineus]